MLLLYKVCYPIIVGRALDVVNEVYGGSLCVALRIQVSEHCKGLLDQLGVYEFDDRGQVEVKVSRRTLII